ncbi:DUF1819 family protein [Rothia sp. 11273D007AR]
MGENAGRYLLSFSAGALMLNESLAVARVYGEVRDWEATRQYVVENNSIQAAAESSLKRYTAEVVGRLKVLTDDQLGFLADASAADQKLAVWVAICRRYTFIGEFAEDVVRQKFLLHDYVLTHEDYDRFVAQKMFWHEELEELTELTQKKLRSVIFKMLGGADLVNDAGLISMVFPSAELLRLFDGAEPGSTARFLPTFEGGA